MRGWIPIKTVWGERQVVGRLFNQPLLVQRGVPVPTPGVVLVSPLIGFVFPLKGF